MITGQEEMKKTKEISLFEKEIIPMYADLFRYLLHLGCPHAISKDIAQATMERAWVHRSKILYVDYKKQWLLRVAFNEYMNHLRESAREYSYSEADMMLDESESERFTNDALDALVKREDLMLLKEALDRLEPKYAVPIRLRYFGELSHREISEAMGLNYSTTRSVIARGLMKLKTIFMELDR